MASKILLADDSITIQKVVNLTFADEGIDVITVSNGEMAERRLSEINPDLVLADIFMPGKNGYELCQFIKDTPPFQNIPVVLLVGAFEPFDQSEARRVRADGHLTKPFESRTLVETVRKLIQTSRSKAVKQTPAKQPQAVRETRPLALEPEPRQDAFIDITQLATDGSPQAAPQNGAPPAGIAQQGSLATAGSGADPLAVDYHGIWEIGTGSDPSVESHAGVASDLSFGIDLGKADAPQDPQPGPLFSPGFEISTPQDAQPATNAFEFGFAEPSGDAQPASHESQATHGAEAEQVSIPSSPTNGASEQATGFAVPSLFSDSAANQVLDFRQVDAPETPAPASEVSFELSSAPAEPSEPAPDLGAAPATDGKYFDLIGQEGLATTAQPEVIQWSGRPESQSGESAVAVESGFDLAGPATTPGNAATPELEESGFDLAGLNDTPLGSTETPERGQSLVEEEPLGDVFSADKPASAPEQETSFVIAEEAVTVDVRPPASESFRMVLPPAQEREYTGVWPQLDSDQSGGSPASKTDAERIGGNSISGSETPLGTDFSSRISPERSFAISETGAVETPFDPMELRADEPTDAPPAAPIHNDFRPEPAAEPFTSSLMWSAQTQPSVQNAGTVAVDEPLGQVLGTAAEETEAGSVEERSGAAQQGFDLAGGGALEAPAALLSSGAEVTQTSLGAFDGAVVESQPALAPAPSSINLPPAAIDEIVRRVVHEMSDAIVRELAWEILPDCVERVVEKLSRESLAKKL